MHIRFQKRTISCLIFLLLAVPSFAVEAGQVAYSSGSLSNIPQGTIGTLATDSPAKLVFKAASTSKANGGEIEILYQTIQNFRYYNDVAHHIGVLPAIAVGLVKQRERKHFMSISYTDSSNALQVVIFEIPKNYPPTLIAILRARTPQLCRNKTNSSCNGTP